MASQENKAFLDNKVKQNKHEKVGCCYSRHTRNCCFVCCVVGALLLLLGIIVLAAGYGLLMNIVQSKMPLEPNSDRYKSWLNPPVQPYLTGYAFNVTNPDEVVLGMKPILQEVGPFVYKAVTIKDSRDNVVFEDDGETLTYRPRKFYYVDLEQSVADPDKTYIFAPNIPMITGFSGIRDKSWIAKKMGQELITQKGLGTPFVNVSFSGLLWGYPDDLPCALQSRPENCPDPASAINFGEKEEETEDDSEDEDDSDDDSDDFFDFKRKKRSVEGGEPVLNSQAAVADTDSDEQDENAMPNLRYNNFEEWAKPKGGYENCTCYWGLFRDRNVTLRKPVTIYHGMSDVSKKGWVKKFDSSPVMNWWEKDSKCDELGGFDGGTLPPGLTKHDSLDIFISLMCRRLNLEFEKEEHYSHGLVANRYVPPENALGSHLDQDPKRRNEANSCYCVDGFRCFESGVLNMAPCKVTSDRPKGAPLALSYPHFYQADPRFINAVEGLEPNKERHQFYVDLSPELGVPLAIRPRFQLNIVIRRDEDIPIMSKFAEELVLPFLWAQDGFDQPTEEMSTSIRKALDIPSIFSRLLGVLFVALGAGLLIGSLVWILWEYRTHNV